MKRLYDGCTSFGSLHENTNSGGMCRLPLAQSGTAVALISTPV